LDLKVRKMQNEEFHNLYSSPNIRVITSDMAIYVACLEDFISPCTPAGKRDEKIPWGEQDNTVLNASYGNMASGCRLDSTTPRQG
jgi:hypothetical protein